MLGLIYCNLIIDTGNRQKEPLNEGIRAIWGSSQVTFILQLPKQVWIVVSFSSEAELNSNKVATQNTMSVFRQGVRRSATSADVSSPAGSAASTAVTKLDGTPTKHRFTRQTPRLNVPNNRKITLKRGRMALSTACCSSGPRRQQQLEPYLGN